MRMPRARWNEPEEASSSPTRYAQQGGLADAVRPDDGQPLAFGDAEGQPAEDVAVPEGFGQVGDGDEGQGLNQINRD